MATTETEGALRVWNVINPPAEPDHYRVADPLAAYHLIDDMANAQLKQDWIDANAFGLEVYREGEWEEWYDEEDNDLDGWAEANGHRQPDNEPGENPYERHGAGRGFW